MIIAWRFADKVINKGNIKKDNFSIIPILTHINREKNITPTNYGRLITKINECKNNKKESLVLIHTPQFEKKEIEEIMKFSSDIIKIYKFEGGDGEIYEILDLDRNCFKNLSENILKTIWEGYSVKQKIIKLKNEVISLLLPLAIDIQGLSEVEDNNKIEGYFDEIKKSYQGEDSKKIKNILKEIKKEDIEIDDIGKYTDILNFFLNEEANLDNFYKNYCDTEKAEFFLPTWLKNVAKKIDEKIKQY